MKKDDVAVIIPTYNEKENILRLVNNIHQIFRIHKIIGTIIIVYDNSPDGTGKIADKIAEKYGAFVIHREKNRGYGNSIVAGIKKALEFNYKIIITMDSDFSHDPDVIPQMISELKRGNDIVIGSRRIRGGEIRGWNIWRHFCSFGASWISKLILGINTKDTTSGYRAYSSRILKKIKIEKIKSNGYSFLDELLFYIEEKTKKIKEIPIIFQDRKKGRSKLSNIEIIKFFITLIRLRINLLIKNKTLFKFLMVGFTGIFVNMFFLWFFKSVFLVDIVISGILAIEISVLTNFIFNDWWTFRDRLKTTSKIVRFLKYNLSVLFGVFLNYSILILFTYIGLFYMLSNLVGIIFATLSNYLFSTRWAWK